MILLTFFKLIFLVYTVNGGIPNISSNILISKTVYAIIEQFYVIRSSKMYLSQSALTNASYFIQSDIINEILSYNNYEITLKIDDVNTLKPETSLKSYNIFFIDG